jgi:hypothetical protein
MTMVFSVYTRTEGKKYIQQVLSPIIQKIAAEADRFEVDPNKLEDTEVSKETQAVENAKRLQSACRSILKGIFESLSILPKPIRKVSHLVWKEMMDPELLNIEKDTSSEHVKERDPLSLKGHTGKQDSLPSSPSMKRGIMNAKTSSRVAHGGFLARSATLHSSNSHTDVLTDEFKKDLVGI